MAVYPLYRVGVVELSDEQIGTFFLHEQHGAGVEGFEAVIALIILERFEYGGAGLDVFFRDFDLDDEFYFSVDEREHLLEQRDAFVGAEKSVFSEVFRSYFFCVFFYAARAFERRVVMDDESAVVCQIDVKLDAVSVFDGVFERREGVFGHRLVVVESAVRKRYSFEEISVFHINTPNLRR